MINILVVDDEPISADGISIYLMEHGARNWNIMTAYSSVSALKFSKHRIDILVTDIMMPQMDGFALQREVYQRWPMVKTIFLTGNQQLDFAQRAIRTESIVDYVLKIEDEDAILRAIEKAVDQLEHDMSIQDALHQARTNMQHILPMLRKDFILALLKDNVPAPCLLDERLKELDIPLLADRPVLLLIAQLAQPDPAAEQLHYCTFDSIIEKFLSPVYRFCSTPLEGHRILVLIQLHEVAGTIDIHHAFSLLELAQQMFSRTATTSTLVLNHSLCSWQEIGQHYRAMLITLERNTAIAEDVLLLHKAEAPMTETLHSHDLNLLRLLLEQQDYDKAGSVCRNLPAPQTASGKITLYRHLLKLYSITADAQEDPQAVYSLHPIPACLLTENGWKKTQAEFVLLFKSFASNPNTPVLRKEKMIQEICDYVEEHLAEDLSLMRISEITSRTATYISKLFAEIKGMNYNAYVVSRRLVRATELMADTSLSLRDIITQVGYNSTSYFIHAFRSQYGITPKEYQKTHFTPPENQNNDIV